MIVTSWIRIRADRVLYVHRGINIILCDDGDWPNGAEFVLGLSDESKWELLRELSDSAKQQ